MEAENRNSMIFIVDDDISVRKSLERLIRSTGLSVKTFSSGQEFLDEPEYDGNSCLITDVRMPGINGMELQRRLNETEKILPLIFITGHDDIQMSVNAMKRGAVDFLSKPFNDLDILNAIRQALDRNAREKAKADKRNSIKKRFESLTPREQEVFSLVVRGMLNKQVAFDLGISVKTVKIHRARVMEKMKADSFADLVRMADRLQGWEDECLKNKKL